MSTTSSPTTPTPRRARRRGRFALGLGIAAGLTALWAAPSAALLTETDSVTIRSVGYDLGDDTWDPATGRPATGGLSDQGKLIHRSVTFHAKSGTITDWGLW